MNCLENIFTTNKPQQQKILENIDDSTIVLQPVEIQPHTNTNNITIRKQTNKNKQISNNYIDSDDDEEILCQCSCVRSNKFITHHL